LTPEKYFIETGKTIEEAISKVIKKLKCSRNEIEIEILDNGGGKKLLGLVRTPITVGDKSPFLYNVGDYKRS